MDETPVTSLLQRACDGDDTAKAAFYRSVESELRRIAGARLQSSNGDSLQVTMLVDDVFVNLVHKPSAFSAKSRTEFFRLARRTMRNLIVDHIRKRNAQKRGGALMRRPEDLVEIADPRTEKDEVEMLESVQRAMEKLERRDERAARIVQMRCLADMRLQDIAEILGVSLTTVKTDWRVAKAFLYREISDEAEHAG